jgi:enolase
MVERDGTDDLRRLGANAVLSVSGAALHAASAARDRPLYAHLAEVTGREPSLPTPMVNVLSGGLHAGGGFEVQDLLAVPLRPDTLAAGLETVWSVRRAVRDRIEAAGDRPQVADEGGFAPPLPGVEAALDLLVGGIEDAGHVPGRDVGVAVDVAATHFHDAEADRYRVAGADRTPAGMADLVAGWCESYPVVSVEDPLAEDDWAGWVALADRLDGVQLLGDDLVVTDVDRLRRAVDRGAANAVLVKPNQAGTVSRTLDVVAAAREAGVATVVSARSGETCDATVADLAVGLDAGQVKIGSLARSERLAKYNRLLETERETGAPVRRPFAGD